MKVDEVKEKLKKAGEKIKDESRLGNNTGLQLRLESGSILNVYDKGTVSLQGKSSENLQKLFRRDDLQPQQIEPTNKIFVVYGHDNAARHQLEAMLRRWGLDPVILDQLPSEGQTIIEKLENFTEDVGFGVVLATPDDEGHKAGHPDEKTYRARQNVVLELGILLARLGRSKVAVLIKEPGKMERPSDIQGLIYIPFKDDVGKEAGVLLAKELASQGFKIDIKKL